MARQQAEQGKRVFVIEIAGAGGICHYTWNLIRGFAADVRPVLYTGCPYELAGMSTDIDYRCTFRRLRTNPLRVLGILRDALRERPAAVHFQLSQHPELVLLLQCLLLIARTPQIVTAHNVLPHERQWWHRLVFRAIYRLADSIIVHSRHSREELARELGVPAEKIRVIPHGNYMFFESGDDRPVAATSPFRILFFGYIRRYKGLTVLLEALAQVRDHGCDFVLDVVGKPVEPWEPYQRLIDSFQLGDRVETRLGYVPVEEVPEYFRRAAVVVLPYLNISQSGVLHLAYAFSRPVIVTRTGGLPEVVDEGHSGFVVPPGDVDALAERLEQLIRDPDSCTEMGRHARELATTRYAWDGIARDNAALYCS